MRGAGRIASSRGSHPRTAAGVVLVAILFVGLLPSALGNVPWASRPPSGAAPSPEATEPSLVAPTPAAGVPGAPAHRMVTVPLSGAPAAPYAGPVRSASWTAYDPADASYWVASPPRAVDVVSGSRLVLTAVLPVGQTPFGVAIDPTSSYVWVTNRGSANVTVLSPTTLSAVANVTVQSAPTGIAIDATDGTAYVADSATDNVTVVSTASFRVVTNVSVGTQPLGVAWDPATDQVFVSNHGSGTVSAIDARTATVTGTIAVGSGPYGLAVDNDTDTVYVADERAYLVTVVSAASDTVVASVPVLPWTPIDLEGVVYDWGQKTVWVAGGWYYAIVINTTREVVADYVSIDPSGAAYDPTTGDVCVTNSANETFVCFDFTHRLPWVFDFESSPLRFVESGLPAGTVWTVTLVQYGISTTGTSNTSAMVFGLEWFHLSFRYNISFTVGPVSGYTAAPSSGHVTGPAGTPVSVRIVFT